MLSKAPPVRQFVQPVAVPSLHSEHRELQTTQALFALAYFPLGHTDTHVPASKNGVPAAGQLTQSVLPGPPHALHVESQARQAATNPMAPE
jgi:hypothetical protein